MPHEIPEDADPAECFAREMRIKNALEAALHPDEIRQIHAQEHARLRAAIHGAVCRICWCYVPGEEDTMTLT